MMTMTITPWPTPNPNARKYVLDRAVGLTMANFVSVEAANAHPLPAQLFQISGVTNVFLTADFVTVNKEPGRDWDSMEPAVIAVIQAHFAA